LIAEINNYLSMVLLLNKVNKT